MATLPIETLEHRAFREAGHAVMSFLIRKGYTTQFVPLDRSLILAPFQFITLDEPGASWNELTFSLGSLITTAQVLSAGYLAERIQYRISEPPFPPDDAAVQTALHLTGAYIEEYGGDAMTMRERDIQALDLFHKLFEYVEEQLHTYWICVDTLAKQLLDVKTLSEEKVFDTIEQSLPEGKKLGRDTVPALEPGAVQSKVPPSPRKRWWQFWKRA